MRKRVKYSTKCRYQKIINKYPARLRILLVHFLEMYLTLYQTILDMEPSRNQGNVHLNLMAKTHALANTKQNIVQGTDAGKHLILALPHCEGPTFGTFIVQHSGGGDHLVLFLFPYRNESIEFSSSCFSFPSILTVTSPRPTS